jgi:Heparinase II/III-like protein/Heparinase II/III N-terminus
MPDGQQLNEPWSGKIRRIASMSVAEISDRIRQGLHKRSDAIFFGFGFDPCRAEIREPEAGLSPRFFFRDEDVPQITRLLRERMPEQVEAITRSAEKICQHRFDLLGYEDLNYGREIDWHLDRVHGKRAPRDLWFKIKYLDFASVGDAKVTWELSRHQHLVTLAKAYRLRNDPRYASELLAQLQNWHKENPYPHGINWASSLEVAFRSLSWLWVYFLLNGTSAMTPEFRQKWLQAMAISGRHIERYMSTYFSPNTHLLGEAVALFFIGTLCPELRSSSRWKHKSWEIVFRESQRQVRPDGFYFEQSTYYHVYALDLLLHARVLASLNDMPFPPDYHRRLEQMLNAFALLCRAGTPPHWGDDDGGRVFDAQRNRAEHLSDPLATGAVMFGRGDFKFLAGGLREETLWLLGEKGASKFDRLEAKQPDMNSVALPESGMYVMSCADGKLQAVIDAGPQGALAAGHGHADALSLTLHAAGRQLLGDPGTFQYVGPDGQRDQFRGTSAHNTLQMDRRDQSTPKGPFAWERLAGAKADTWVIGQTFDLFVGSHYGYLQTEAHAIHQRSVFFLKPKFWLVRDLILGTGRHRIDLRWHIHPSLASPLTGDSLFFSSKQHVGIAIITAEEASRSRTVERTTWSPVYGKKESASTIRFTAESTLPTEIATVLAPLGADTEHISQQAKLIHYLPSLDRSAYRLIDDQQEHCCVFSQKDYWAFEEWISDAHFVYFCTTNGRLAFLTFCNGTYVDFRGVRLASAPQRVDRCEIIFSEGKMKLVSPRNGIVLPNELACFEIAGTVPPKSGKVDL